MSNFEAMMVNDACRRSNAIVFTWVGSKHDYLIFETWFRHEDEQAIGSLV